jgi:sulfatase maturation enzyme AslB (radical SAM superfamily)
MSQMTNVIYLTTDCNLDCEYCYEANKRKAEGFVHFTLTEQQIDEFIVEIEKREGDAKCSTIVLMGGEPTMAMGAMKYFVEQCIESGKRLNKLYHAKITSNGLNLLSDKFYKEFFELLRSKEDYHHFGFTLEISYDGVGHDRRKKLNGKSSKEQIEQVLEKLNKDKIPFHISYTVHEENWDKLHEDAIRIFEKYPAVERIQFSIAFQMLDNVKLGLGMTLRQEYKPIMKEIYAHYGKPVCAFVCGECKQCDKSNYTGNRYLSPTKGIMTAKKRTEKQFDQF